MKKKLIKTIAASLLIASITAQNVLAVTLTIDGYPWQYGNLFSFTLKHVQFSDYSHGKKDHSTTAMVDGVYNKTTAGPGKRAYSEVVGSRNPNTYNSYYNYW